MFDFPTTEFRADYSLGSVMSPTISPELPTWDLGGNQITAIDQTSQPVPKPSGDFFSNGLRNITATAETFLNGVKKVYELDNKITSDRLQQKQIESGLVLQDLQTRGAIDLRSVQLSAQKEIGIIQAQNAVKDARAQSSSSGLASYVTAPKGISIPLVLALVAGVYFFAKGGMK